MSRRRNAPYRDTLEDEGSTLIYEGHDAPRSQACPNPKLLDQPEHGPSGALTENGRFHRAAQEYRQGLRAAEIVRVYEKLHQGIWSYNGAFQLVDSWQEEDDHRQVFKFKLIAVEGEPDMDESSPRSLPRRRMIPTAVKLEVWRRDKGRCVMCGATDELHFDHDLPYSLGGTSLTAQNVQLLCARHNLQKGDKLL